MENIQIVYAFLILVSSGVLSAVIGAGIAEMTINRLGVSRKDTRYPAEDVSIRYSTREMIYATKEWVAYLTAVMSTVVYSVKLQASLAYSATVLLTLLLWFLAKKFVFPEKVGTNFKQSMNKELVGSIKSEDDKPAEQIHVIERIYYSN